MKTRNLLLSAFGCITPLIPFLGHHYLLLAAAVIVMPGLLKKNRGLESEEKHLLDNPLFTAFIPFLLIILSWSLARIAAEFDLQSYLSLYKYNQLNNRGLANYVATIAAHPLNGTHGLLILSRFLLLVSLIIYFSKSRDSLKSFMQGLVGGVLVACVITLLQILAVIPYESFPNYSSFWRWQNRFPGTFTDPNAFGIFACLALPLLAVELAPENKKQRILIILSSVLLFSLAWFSGSRSFVLGLAIQILAACFLLRQKAGLLIKKVKAAYLIAAVPVLLSAICLLILKTSTGSRLLTGITSENISAAFYSRSLFWKLGAWIWQDNFFFGSGVNSFRSLVTPYLMDKGIDLNLWSDNSNNFYLGLLAEYGVLGFGCFLLGAFGLIKIFRSCAQTCATEGSAGNWRRAVLKAALIAFGILLLIGPHLDFDEVLVIFAALTANYIPDAAVEYGSNSARRICDWKIILACSLIAFLHFPYVAYKAARLQDWGFYQWEKDQGGVYRWSRPKSRFWINCPLTPRTGLTGDNKAEIRIRSPRIQTVTLKTPFEDALKINFSGNKTQKIPITCNKKRMPVEISTEKIFVPDLMKAGRDKRLLGIQLYQDFIS